MINEWWQLLLIIVGGIIVTFFISALLYRPVFKRLYDILLSFFALLILSPILLFLIIIGAIAMKGNPFFTQERPGKINKKTGKEKIFKLIKFRTMSNAKDKDGNLLPDEVRLNKYGKFLRATSLDELPEILNIFAGQMSIIGPRPQLVRDMLFMNDETRKRHSVRPGLTGLAQVNGRNNISWQEKFDYDLKYVNKITIWKDMAIFFKTILKVFKRSDINRDGTASDIDYGDWLLKNGEITQEEYDERMSTLNKMRKP